MIESLAVGVGGGLAVITISQIVRWMFLSVTEENKLTKEEMEERDEIRRKLAVSYSQTGENVALVDKIIKLAETARVTPVGFTMQDRNYKTCNVYESGSVSECKDLLVQILNLLSQLRERV